MDINKLLGELLVAAIPLVTFGIVVLVVFGIKYLKAHTKNAALASMLDRLEAELTKHVNDLSEKETADLRAAVNSDKGLDSAKLQEVKEKLIANAQGEAKGLIKGLVTPGDIIAVLKKVI